MTFVGGADSGLQGECPVGSTNLCDSVHNSRPGVPSFAGCAQEAEEQVLNQLMLLFGKVEPAPADQVFAIGYQYLQLAKVDVPTWDMVPDALIQPMMLAASWSPSYNAFLCHALFTFWT